MPNIWQFAVLVVFVVTLLAGVNAVYWSDSATVLQQKSDEELIVDYHRWQTVNESARTYLDNETVVDNGGTKLSEGTDYLWNTTDGTVKFLNTTETTKGNPAYIDYWFHAPTTGGALTIGVMQHFGSLLGAFLFVAGAFAMWNLANTGGI